MFFAVSEIISQISIRHRGVVIFPFSLIIYAVNVAVPCDPWTASFNVKCWAYVLRNKEQKSNKKKRNKLTVSSSKAKDPKFYSSLSLSLP